MSTKEKTQWVEKIGDDYIFHNRTNEFTVVTREATKEEIEAFETVPAEIDQALVEDLTAKNETLTAANDELATNNELLVDENAELKKQIEALTAEKKPEPAIDEIKTN